LPMPRQLRPGIAKEGCPDCGPSEQILPFGLYCDQRGFIAQDAEAQPRCFPHMLTKLLLGWVRTGMWANQTGQIVLFETLNAWRGAAIAGTRARRTRWKLGDASRLLRSGAPPRTRMAYVRQRGSDKNLHGIG